MDVHSIEQHGSDPNSFYMYMYKSKAKLRFSKVCPFSAMESLAYIVVKYQSQLVCNVASWQMRGAMGLGMDFDAFLQRRSVGVLFTLLTERMC